MRVLEAIYPHPTTIEPLCIANNDQRIPVVPITPIEDEHASIDSTSYNANNTPTPTNANPMVISQSHHQQQQRRSSHIITPQPNNGHSVEPGIIAAQSPVHKQQPALYFEPETTAAAKQLVCQQSGTTPLSRSGS